MAYDTATRKKVRAHYVQGLPLSSAAAKVGVPYNTARNWKRTAADDGDDWDLARAAKRMTTGAIEELASELFALIAEECMATIKALRDDKAIKPEVRGKLLVALMDGYTKALGAAANASPNTNRLAAAMDLIRWLAGVFAQRFPKLHKPFVDACEELGPDLVRAFGKGG